MLQPETPEISTLPRSRIAVCMWPFSYTSIDYFGPYLTKHGRRVKKNVSLRVLPHVRYISDDFQMLVAHRDMPNEIYCDNGTNLYGAGQNLHKIAESTCKLTREVEFARIR